MKSINHNELDEMPKMKGGNSKRGKKEPKTEWDSLSPEEEQIVRMPWLKEHIQKDEE
jgi:hypothetical protein